MLGYINGYDFGEMEAMKYYAPPASWTDQKKKDTVRNRIFSGDWMAAEKKDGFFGKLVKDEDGVVLLYTRSRNTQGKFVSKVDWVPQLHPFFASLPAGTCLLGEMYLPSQPGSKNVQTILGCLADKARDRQEKGEKIHFYVFDCLAYGGKSLMTTKYGQRAVYVESMKNDPLYQNEFVTYAEYHEQKELWDYLQMLLADGKEGIVLMSKDGLYEPGKRPSKTTLKVKQELKQTIDCVIIGANPPATSYNGKYIGTWQYWMNEITGEKLPVGEHYTEYYDGAPITPITKNYYFGWAGSLRLGLWENGKPVYFGDLSGLTEEILSDWHEYLGEVCEVGGMSIDDVSGHIRHPRFLGWRVDKKPEDCTIDQVK